jgi:hypothetical protein
MTRFCPETSTYALNAVHWGQSFLENPFAIWYTVPEYCKCYLPLLD